MADKRSKDGKIQNEPSPDNKIQDLLQLAIREYRRHDRNRHYMKHRRHVTSRPTDRVDPPRFEQRMDLRSDMYYS